ncbi:MAG: non-ribosomal peptide synthase/polyketide synthase, partial [Ferruginibacter sp.]
NQVKIRGYRIELGEIETILEQSELVSQAVVLAREDKQGNKRLIGYIIAEGYYDREGIIAYLKDKLPDYMVPALLMELESFPLTANGKIDRKALPDPDAGELLNNQYTAPRNEAEQVLAGVWQDVLGVDQVGIHDDFFELGGDSIITIQVVSRARRLGYELQVGDIFNYPTIASLSALIDQRADTEANVTGEQSVLTGPSGLLPIQEWFLENEQLNPSHFNQSVLLGIDKRITEPVLKAAIKQIMVHHDALRFKYYQIDQKWQQAYGEAEGVIITEDLKNIPTDQLGNTITEKADNYQRSLDIEKGELVRAVWMQTPAGEATNRLLMVVHHLAVDGVSWRILLEDLELLLGGQVEGGKTSLGHKTSSYRQWYEGLQAWGQSKKVLHQSSYWQQVKQSYAPLPTDKLNNGSDSNIKTKAKDILQYSVKLSEAQTQQLLQEVPRVYHTQINDILLAALAGTLCNWNQQDKVVIGMEGHGREEIGSATQTDTSRTIGWFTTHYPVLLQTQQQTGELIKSIKEQLRTVPDRGLGYGVLKYINKEEALQGQEPWDIIFNYLGQLDNVVSQSKWLTGAGESQGAGRSEEYGISEKLVVNSLVQSGELTLSWSYSSLYYEQQTIEQLAQAYISKLEEIISHCITKQKEGQTEYTPSDYGIAPQVSYQELDSFLDEPFRDKKRKDWVEGIYFLSGLQQGMLFHSLYDGGAGAYTEQFACDLAGVNLELISKSWEKILQRHTILRSAFYYEAFQIPVQVVYREVQLPVEVLDYRSMSETEQVIALKQYQQADIDKGFDLQSAPLMRLTLVRMADTRYRMLWTWNHILFDGWSLAVLMEEFLNVYESLATGKQIQIIPDDRYEDYIRYIERTDKATEESYWRNYLKGVEETTLLPFIGSNINRTKGAGNYQSHTLELNTTATASIQNFAQKNRLTVNTVMQGVWSCLLHNYTGNNDIVYGVIVSGRPDDLPGVEKRVGMYINTLPLHSALNEGQNLVKWLQAMQAEQVISRGHQHTPLQDIQSWSPVQGDMFDSLMVFENYPISKVVSSGQWSLQVSNVHKDEQSNYPLTIIVASAEQVSIKFSYNVDLLKEEYVKEISDHFENVLLQLTEADNAGVSIHLNDIKIITAAETHQLVEGFNNTKADYPKDKSIIDLFTEQSAKTPNAIALKFEEQELTYKELNERSNQLANYLRSRGVKEEMLVPICVERSIEMIVGILGILKAGAAYVPIDPAYPQERINYMLADTAAALMVSSSSTILSLKDIEIILLDTQWPIIDKQPKTDLQLNIKASNLAYVIYTSGSTGTPKGVIIEHKAVVSLVKGIDYVSLSAEDILLSTGSSSFDATTFEYWSMLLNGGQLILCPENTLLESDLLKKEIDNRKISKMWFTSSWFNQLVETNISVFEGLESILVGGEKLSEQHIKKVRETYPSIKIINGYGPTENTTFSLTYHIKNDLITTIPIGRPLSNRNVFVVNKNLRLVPIGVPGEICLGGDGLARGYLNQPELTAEKFVKNPFSKEAGTRMYRTGDIGKWLPDGNIEYLGRRDEQVKIRGYRIELGEIETVLLQSGLVSQAVVLVKEDKQGHKRLVGYIVAIGSFDKQAILNYLQGKLPDYMVPALWVELKSLPLTPNGKIDKRSLPEPDASELLSNEYVAPRNELEVQLANIWKQLLDVEQVGIHDNFFELGGDSIITIQVVSRARRLGYELLPKDIFVHQTIDQLSAAIAERTGALVSGEQGLLTGFSGLVPIQQWWLHSDQPDPSHFNQSVLLGINKSVTAPVLEVAVKQLILRHDALRFKYNLSGTEWKQEYGNDEGKIFTEDLQSISPDKFQSSIKEIGGAHQRGLHIEKGELIRIVWIQTPAGENTNRLLIAIHHLAIDGVSWRILLEDFELLLTGLMNNNKTDLGHKSSSYRQWFEALQQYGQSQQLLAQQNHWKQAIKNYQPLLIEKEYDGKITVKDTVNFSIRLPEEQTQKLLQEIPKVYHTQVNDILLAALAKTLCTWTSKEKVVIGLEGHGREDLGEGIDTSRTIGWFTTQYPVVLRSAKGEANLIKSVKEQLRVIPNAGLGFGVLKYINKDTALQGTDPWDIVFNYLGQFDNVVKDSNWFSAEQEPVGSVRSDKQFVNEKLAINSLIQGGELVLRWTYSNLHFEPQTIEQLAASYITNLEALISHCIEQQQSGEAIYTPSDYGLAPQVSYSELDGFLEESFNGKKRKDSIEGIYRLSGLQQGMLFHSLYNHGGGAYIEQFSCDLLGVDLNIISKSWEKVLMQHSILRSAFYSDSFSVPVQCVYRDIKLPVDVLDYSGMSTDEQAKALQAYKEADRIKGFDFSAPPLMRLALIKLDGDAYRMIWTSHHILFDGWSMPILIEEFLTIYESLVSGNQLAEVPEDRYEDYIRYIDRTDKEKEEKYWRNYLKGIQESTHLPFIGTSQERNKGVGVYQTMLLELDPAAATRVQSFAQKNRLTVNTVMQGVWSCLLHRYTRSNDITYGVIVSGRPDDLPGVEKRVGMYINTLPLRSEIKDGQTLVEWLQAMQADQVASRNFQHTALQDIQGWAGLQGDIFDSLLVFENYPVSKIVSSNKWALQIRNVQMDEQTNYPLTLIIASAEQITIKFSYNAALLSTDYIKEISGHFQQVLLEMISNDASTINDFKIITPTEEQQLLVDFNNTAIGYLKDKNIINLFEEQVAKTPQAIAVVLGDDQLSYDELNTKSSQLAHYLRSKGVKEEMLVPICIERSMDMIVGILAILKAGGAYVPIDPEYPQDRISYMLEDIAATIVVSSKQSSSKLEANALLNIIEVDTEWTAISKQPTTNLQINSDPNHVAYIIYTSGSTGRPKGVMIPNINVVRLFKNDSPLYDFNEKDVWTLFHSFCFDFSVWEMYGALFYGGKIVIVPSAATKDVSLFSQLLVREGVTVLNQTPSAFYALQEYITEKVDAIDVRYVIFGGEALNPAKLQPWKQQYTNCALVNMYGITETTVHVTYQQISPEHVKDSRSIIGKPIPTLYAYIVDTNRNLVPIGVPGELWVGGAGVAKGYLNRPELTAEKFVNDPFSKEASATVYKTGDLGRWMADGTIEYLGRIDDQVKIRGFRIELGEIETVLMQSGLMSQAVVLAKADKEGQKSLVGYVVPKESFDREAVTRYLKNRLPEYMVPAMWVELQTLPITSNGKIDKKALPAPETTSSGNTYIAPETSTEKLLVSIWERILGKENIGIKDNFFHIGGDSIKVIRLVGLANKELDAPIEIKDIFEQQDIESLAFFIDGQTGNAGKNEWEKAKQDVESVEATITNDRSLASKLPQDWEHIYPMSDIQKGMLYLSFGENSAGVYHDQLFSQFNIDLDFENLKKAFTLLTEKHAILRTSFHFSSFGKPIQIVHKQVHQDIFQEDLSHLNRAEQKSYLEAFLEKDRQNPFEITRPGLWRIFAFKLQDQEYIFLWVVHHAIIDGWSFASLQTELSQVYFKLKEDASFKPVPLHATYKDYLVDQSWVKQSKEAKIFWANNLEEYSRTNLPFGKTVGFDEPRHFTPRVFFIEADLSKELQGLSDRLQIHIKEIYLAAFVYLLKVTNYTSDVTIGVVSHGRPGIEDGDKLIGCFLNTVPFRYQFNGSEMPVSYLEAISKNIRALKSFDKLSLVEIVESIGGQRGNGNPIFDIIFNYIDFHIYDQKSEEVSFKESIVSLVANTNTFFDVSIIRTKDSHCININTLSNLYHEEDINRIVGYFKNILHLFTKEAPALLSTKNILPNNEVEILLQRFNDTKISFSNNKSVIDLFEAQVSLHPDSVALVFGQQQLTYKELNERSNQLAHFIKGKGVKPETLVPVCIERSIDLVVSLIAILKAGAAYVPIDPGYPQERISYMLEDTAAKIVISSSQSSHKLQSANIEIIEPATIWNEISNESSDNVELIIKPGQLAYVIYTSGSTGKPKGVMIEHTGVVNLIEWHNREYEVTEFSRSTAMAGIGFDAFGWEIWPYLSVGAMLHIIDDDQRLSPVALSELFIENSITHSFISTALVPEFINASGSKITSLKYLLTGGDKLSSLDLTAINFSLVNNYGPTENTVVTTNYKLAAKDSDTVPPIGKPISNTSIYIINNDNQLAPQGVPGELCIEGVGVARGYLNLPELTAEKFIAHSFNNGASGKMYKTGDLARWLADGNIEYLGRVDEQVKIRGYRIELGEIESVLMQSGLISQAIVLAKEDNQGSKRLVGYIVLVAGIDHQIVISYLHGKLPDYMVPALWVELQSLPLTPNGKIDKKALPEPDASGSITNKYVAPRNEVETKMAEVWQRLLHVERVGVEDNFFELGGDSILTIQVVSQLRRFGYEMQPKDIFVHQTIGQLSLAIAQRSGSIVSGEQGMLTGLSGLLPIQQWYFETEQANLSHFNQSVLLKIDKSVTEIVLTKAIQELMAHHDALRFKYYKNDGEWQQAYGDIEAQLITLDLSSTSQKKLASIITKHADSYQHSLDIEKGEIMRAVWMQTPQEEDANRLLIVIHHLAVDGVSWRILLEDLELLVNGLMKVVKTSLAQKSSSYRQWCQALQKFGTSKQVLAQKKYWQQITENFQPLKTDKTFKGKIKSKDTVHYSVRLGIDQTQTLVQKVPGIYHTQINDILLAALTRTLTDWTKNDKIVIGLEGHGREDISTDVDISRTVGWFTNLYPVLLDSKGINDYDSLIKSVKERLLAIPSKGIGYGVLKYINKETTLQGAEPWDIIFNYLGQLDNVVRESKWLAAANESAGTGRNKADVVNEKLAVNGLIQGGELILNWSYSSKYFEQETIENLAASYMSNLNALITHCIAQAAPVYTPSDYGLTSEVNYQELDKFLAEPFNGGERKAFIDGLYRLSGLQQGMLFHSLYDGEAGAYIEQFSCDLIRVDLNMVSQSWAQVLKNHSILRSAFYYDAFSVPIQAVYSDVKLPVELLDYRSMTVEEQTEALNIFNEKDRAKGFDFKAPPLMRLTLIRISDDRYRMSWTSHHILFDGWSVPVLMEEFLSVYESLAAGKEPGAMQEDLYEDFIRYIERGNKAEEENFWRTYLSNLQESTLLPFIGANRERNKGIGIYESVLLQVDAATTASVQSFVQRNHLTVNTVMQGIWSRLLHQYTGNNNIVYGVIVSGRPDDLPNVEKRVGMYINTLPLHSELKTDQPIVNWLQNMQADQVASRGYQYSPLQEIQGWTGITGDMFDSLLVFENYPVSKIIAAKKWTLEVENVHMDEQTNYPLTIIINSAEEISIRFNYNTRLLKQEYVSEIRNHFEHLLLQVIRNEEAKLNDVKIITPVEEQQLLIEFNDTKMEWLKDSNIVNLFEEQAQKTPAAISLIFEDDQLTYKELNERANQLAHYLTSKGVTKETLVPIFIERNTDMLIGILGILKAGAAYIPIDPEYPQERIDFILEDINASIIVSNNQNKSRLITSGIEIIALDTERDIIGKHSVDNLAISIAPDQLAYIIYTSGSTGKPKGVMIEHRSLTHYLLNNKTRYINEGQTGSGSFIHLSYTFDASLTGMFMPLLFGKKIVIGSKQSIEVFEDDNLQKYAPYDFIKITPAHLELLQNKFRDVDGTLLTNRFVIGGEAINQGHFNDLIAQGIDVEIINEYGPTEATVGCSTYSFYTITEKEKISNGISIGKPIANTQMHILGENNELVPIGVKGEICIAGNGLARGYLNREDLTAEKFVTNPFTSIQHPASGIQHPVSSIQYPESRIQHPASRMYRTGDFGRWLPDGNIEYLGRKDDQVKIRGYRIELGEIESVLMQNKLISQAVVLAKENKQGHKHLVGYIVAANEPFDKQQISSWLHDKLPEYMVPTSWIELESLPLTSNGKIDKKALPDPEATGLSSTTYEAPRSETEKALAEIWQQVLGKEKIGIHDNFFELGG